MVVGESGDGGATPAASTLAVDSISRASAVCQRSAIHRAIVGETFVVHSNEWFSNRISELCSIVAVNSLY